MRLDETMFRLDGKVAVVTGGAGGIGGAICELFANVGAAVACLDVDEALAGAKAREVGAAGGRCIGIGCDVASEPSARAALACVERELGTPTVLVNGAATLDRSGTILDIDVEEWERVQRVDVTGIFVMSRVVLPGMIRAGGGSIVHIASMASSIALPGRSSYNAAKGAVLQLGRAMAVDHAAQNVRVNMLAPGAVETRRVAFRYDSLPPEARQAAVARYPMKRFARPAEIAAAALFLASDASSYVTGADLRVDGGYTAL